MTETIGIPKASLNGFVLKWIAIITMVIDHVGAIIFPQHIIFRIIGRISFPIFCFLLVEGFVHTRNIKKYMIRLVCFAVISEIPFNLAIYGSLFANGSQNVFFTLAIGLGLLWIYELTKSKVIRYTTILGACLLAYLFRTDYDAYGILLIFCFYYLRDRKTIKFAAMLGLNLLNLNIIQLFSGLAVIPMALYNGEKGADMKYIFYAFYPVHLLILYILVKYIIH